MDSGLGALGDGHVISDRAPRGRATDESTWRRAPVVVVTNWSG